MAEPFDGWYSGRRVLVTGHNGFLGGWAVRWLALLGAEVSGLSRGVAAGPVAAPAGLVAVRADVTDRAAVGTAMDRCRPEVVLHAAGQALVPAGYADPWRTVTANVLGTAAVLDAALHLPSVRAVVLVGTPAPATAAAPAGPYEASKRAADLVAAAYADPRVSGSRPRTAVARPGVLLGGDWSPGRVLPDAVRAIRACRPVTLHQPAAVRPWQHVLDALSGMLLLGRGLAERDLDRLDYDLGRVDPHGAEPVSEVIRVFLAAYGWPDWPVHAAEPAAPARVVRLGCAAAAAELGWTPTWALGPTLDACARWYRDAGDDAAAGAELADEVIRDFCRPAAAPGEHP